MSRKWLILAAMWMLLATACTFNSAAGPTVPLNQEFTLAPGEAATIALVGLRVRFVEVSGDSRCPADAVCVQGGDAIVHIRVENAATAEHELHTGDTSRAAVTHGAVRIELVNLQPYPFTSRRIEPAEYRATFRVARQRA